MVYKYYRKPTEKGLEIFRKTFGATLLGVNLLIAESSLSHLKPEFHQQYWDACERCLDPNENFNEVSIDDTFLELIFENLTITIRPSEWCFIGNGKNLHIVEGYTNAL